LKLSIIIVNYNVKHFLEQCLHTAKKSAELLCAEYGEGAAEIMIVDNNSADGSCSMVKEKFPELLLIENKENTGFSKANNQGMRIAKGEYFLLLNPDTVVEEDTFLKTVKFMDNHPDAGALGVKMIDGRGNFLPESKRALPTPKVSFYKIFGLATLFPKSEKFGKYHLTYLDKNETHEIEILSGAFMFMRKTALDKAGLLDEDFFMYGEDIDLSYRIIKEGYKNYYFPDTTIIHYKGESTKKGSLNYVFIFYNAMIIFAKKHFSDKNAGLFIFVLKFAIWLRAGISIARRTVKAALLPVADILLIFSGFYFIKPIWENWRFPDGGGYPVEYLMYAVPSYILVWLVSIFFTEGYERPVKKRNLATGIGYGAIIILLFYSLLPETYRYSRALLLIGTLWAYIASFSLRTLFTFTKLQEFGFYRKKKVRLLIIANPPEATRIHKLLGESGIQGETVLYASPSDDILHENQVGSASQLEEIVRINKINEVIFSLQDMTSQEIISHIVLLSQRGTDFKIVPKEGTSVIGSNSIHTSGDLYSIELNSISKKKNIRTKRVVDISLSIVFLLLSPPLFLFAKEKKNYFKNILQVLIGRISWVGYVLSNDKSDALLPKIKKGVFSPVDLLFNKQCSEKSTHSINLRYAKNYKTKDDFKIIFKNLRSLGR